MHHRQRSVLCEPNCTVPVTVPVTPEVLWNSVKGFQGILTMWIHTPGLETQRQEGSGFGGVKKRTPCYFLAGAANVCPGEGLQLCHLPVGPPAGTLRAVGLDAGSW